MVSNLYRPFGSVSTEQCKIGDYRLMFRPICKCANGANFFCLPMASGVVAEEGAMRKGEMLKNTGLDFANKRKVFIFAILTLQTSAIVGRIM